MLDNEQVDNGSSDKGPSDRVGTAEATRSGIGASAGVTTGDPVGAQRDALQPTSVTVKQRRSPWFALLAGVGAIALLLAGFVAIKGLSTDEDTGSDATDEAVSDLTVPSGFRATSDGAVTVLTSTNAAPRSDDASTGAVDVDPNAVAGVGVGDVGFGLTEVRAAEVVTFAVAADRRSVNVTFECVRNLADRITAVRYALNGSTVDVQAGITGGYEGADCGADGGASIDLPFAEPLPTDVTVAAGIVE